MLLSFEEPLAALLAGQEDALEALHALRAADVAREPVHPAFEPFQIVEGGNVDGEDRLAGVGGRGVVGVEVDHIASHRGVVERAGEDAEHQRHAVALVAALMSP